MEATRDASLRPMRTRVALSTVLVLRARISHSGKCSRQSRVVYLSYSAINRNRATTLLHRLAWSKSG